MQQMLNSPLGSPACNAPPGTVSSTSESRISFANLTSWTAPATPIPPHAAYVTPPTPQSKRDRDGTDRQEQQHHSPIPPQCAQPTLDSSPCQEESSGKRSRLNTYQAPREVPSTLLSAMGSLVGGNTEQSNTSVGMRRNLSGGFLEQYLANDDQMDEDSPPQYLVRSMSF